LFLIYGWLGKENFILKQSNMDNKIFKSLKPPSPSLNTSKKIKVLHIITRVRKSGGAERNTLFTIRGLPRDKYEPHLIVGRDSDLDYAREIGQCKIYQINSLVRNINLFKDFKTFLDIYKIIKKNKYDIIHTHLAKAGILGRLAAHWTKAPIIIHGLHGSTFHPSLSFLIKNFYIFLEKWMAKYTDCFISVGADLRDRYLKTGIGCPKKYVVIRSGMDLDKFYNIKTKENNKDIIIGMIASLEPRKGHIYALEVARQLPQVKFVFAGDGYLRNALEKQASDNVEFLGFRKDIENVFAICDVIILTSLWEGLPQVLVQAAACSKPMVSFEVEGAREIIEESINGFVVSLKDTKAMVKRLKYLISDLGRARLMGHKGREIISDEWQIETMAHKTIKLYERLRNKSD